MTSRRITVSLAGLLFLTTVADAAIRNNTIRISVVDSETQSVKLEGSDVPKNCDGANFDAYCNNSKSNLVTNTLLVQEGNAPPFRVSCTVDSRFSRCVALPKGENFDARREKRGITVYYQDDKGKARSQFYTFISGDLQPKPSAKPAPDANSPAPVAHSAPTAPPPPAYVQSNQPAKAVSANMQSNKGERVKCSFNSTPSGADITIDGSYVGNTPSDVSLTTGKHVVMIATPGFGEWKRELTVTADSVVNVVATLQKMDR
jgi:hypothetical protein